MISGSYDKKYHRWFSTLLCQAADLRTLKGILNSGHVMGLRLRKDYASDPERFSPPQTIWQLYGEDAEITTFSGASGAFDYLNRSGAFQIDEGLCYGITCPREMMLLLRGNRFGWFAGPVTPDCRIKVNCVPASEIVGIAASITNSRELEDLLRKNENVLNKKLKVGYFRPR